MKQFTKPSTKQLISPLNWGKVNILCGLKCQSVQPLPTTDPSSPGLLEHNNLEKDILILSALTNLLNYVSTFQVTTIAPLKIRDGYI